MAFASVGALGTATSKSSGASLSLSPTSDVPIGHLVAVWACFEGDGNYTDGGWERDLNLACYDDAGNCYTALQCGFDHLGEAVFLAYVDFPLTTASVITVQGRWTSAQPKAISLHEFSIGSGQRFAVVRDQISSGHTTFEQQDNATKNAQPNDMTIGWSLALDSAREYLILSVIGWRRPGTDSITTDSDYTAIASAGTTGGTDESNRLVTGAYRIVSGITSDTIHTVNATHGTQELIQALVAVVEVELDDDFPTFPNLDTFTRADVDPLPTPPWASGTNRPGQGTALLRNVSGQCARSSSGTFHGAMYFDELIPAGDDGEIFATMAVPPSAGAPALIAFATGNGFDSTLLAYASFWALGYNAGMPGRLGFGGSASGAQGTSQVWVYGLDTTAAGKWGLQFRENGTIVHQWVDDGSGWRWVSAFIIDTTSGSYRNSGKFGLNMGNDFDARVDDFGGGTSIRFIPQIIRRPPDPDGARLPP